MKILLITATDNLTVLQIPLKTFSRNPQTQICVVHQIRNACRYVVWKDKKEFTKDMKDIYDAPTKRAAKAALEDFAEKWNTSTPMPLKAGGITGKNLPLFMSSL